MATAPATIRLLEVRAVAAFITSQVRLGVNIGKRGGSDEMPS
jgi:hypothetical protein